MTRLKDLLPASFKGIPFYVRSEVVTEAGRRIILHDYPNSSQRYVEDLGKLPPRFSVIAFVSGPDFLNLADQLERALQETGSGRLSLPTLGSMTVFAMPYKKDTSQTSVGEIRFDLAFVSGKAISGPSRSPNTVQTVYSKGDTARQAAGDALKNKWIEPKRASNVLTAIFDLTQAAESKRTLLTDVNNVSEIETILDFIGFNGPTIVRSKTDMKSILIDQLWQSTSVGLTGGAGFLTLLRLTAFGSALSLSLADIRSASVTPSTTTSTDIPTWPATTGDRVIRNQNRLTLVNTDRIGALISAYEQAADKTYQTDAELDAARLALETEHQRLMRVDTENRDLIQSQPDVRRAVEDLRLAAIDVLDQKEQSTHTLTSLNLNVPKGAFITAYDLYAEDFQTSEAVTDRAIVVRGLNPTQPADKLYGNVTVLQS